jgi:hypothetical protein
MELNHVKLLACCLVVLAAVCGCKEVKRTDRSGECVQQVQKLRQELHALEMRVENIEKEVEAKEEANPMPFPFVKKPSKSTALKARCEEADGRYWLTAEEAVELRDSDNMWLLSSFRSIPHMEDGEFKGIKLYGIKSDSFVFSCGFRNGDTVVEINELALDASGIKRTFDISWAIEMREAIQKDGEARIKVLRKDELVDINVGVKKQQGG